MKFRYLFINEDQDVTGTNKGDVADEYTEDGGFIIIDCKLGLVDGKPMEEARSFAEDGED